MRFRRVAVICSFLIVAASAGCGGAERSPSALLTGTETAPSPAVSASPTYTAMSEGTEEPKEVPVAPTRMPASPTVISASPTSTDAPAPTSTMMSPEPSATPTVAEVPDIEIVVDNQDSAFSTTGAWFIGDGGQSYNGDCAWAPRGIGNIAHVRPELPLTGAYEIFAWWCGDPNHDQSQRVLIQIHPTTGQVAIYQVYVNLQENAGRWNSLGTYYLEQDGWVSVESYLDGNVVADAFRFAYRSPERIIITPTPIPTAIPWTNNPPSPVEQLTSGDLQARLGLVQRFYPHTPVVSTEEVSFDDCRAFPRDGCGGSRDGWHVQVQYQDMIVSYRVSRDYRFVAIEPPDRLIGDQLLYLWGMRGNLLFQVYHYPDDTWQLAGADLDRTHASQVLLDAETVGALRSLVATYGSMVSEAPDGTRLSLYGLGEQVELSEVGRDNLAELGAELAAAVW